MKKLLFSIWLALIPVVALGQDQDRVVRINTAPYGPSWDGDNTQVAPRNAIYDAIEALAAGSTELDALPNNQAVGWGTSSAGFIRTSETASQTLKIQARDTDGSSWTDAITLTAGATPTMSLMPTTVTGGTVTANTPPLIVTQTWNSGATQFAGLRVDITDTASAAASEVIKVQVGGVHKFGVQKSGNLLLADNVRLVSIANTAVGIDSGNTNDWRDLFCRDVTATDDVEAAGDIVGLTRVINDTDGATLTADDVRGQVYTNTGDTDGQLFNLPPAAAGMRVTFVLSAAADINISPNGLDRILVLTDSIGDAITSDGVQGSRIELLAIDATNWIVLESAGTWLDDD